MHGSEVRSALWTYRPDSLYKFYDTRQVFSSFYKNGIYTFLSPLLLVGRYKVRPNYKEKFYSVLLIITLLALTPFLRKNPVKIAQYYGFVPKKKNLTLQKSV